MLKLGETLEQLGGGRAVVVSIRIRTDLIPRVTKSEMKEGEWNERRGIE